MKDYTSRGSAEDPVQALRLRNISGKATHSSGWWGHPGTGLQMRKVQVVDA